MLMGFNLQRAVYFLRLRQLTCFAVTIGFFALLHPTIGFAAEVRGRIWDAATGKGPTGGRLILECPPGTKGDLSASLVGDGSFSIPNVPLGGSCKLTVSANAGVKSHVINIPESVVRYNAVVREVGDGLVLIPR